MLTTKIEQGVTRNQILNDLAKSSHGKLGEYTQMGRTAAKEHPEFLAHLIAWNQIKGQVRDSKTALPVVSLSSPDFKDPDFIENSLAHLAMLDPRSLVRAYRFAKELSASVGMAGRLMTIRRLIERYLRHREQQWGRIEGSQVQHRQALRELYTLLHIKPFPSADKSIVKGHDHARGSRFDAIAHLSEMSPAEAAGVILEKKLPFLIVAGALGKNLKEPAVALALLNRMTPTELVTNQKLLLAMGVKTIPELRAAYESALTRAAESKQNTFKTQKAVEAIDDEAQKEKLIALQEKQIQKIGGVDGNWLVLGDRSPSMAKSIEVAKMVSATLAKMVKGDVYLVFFDSGPTYYKVTGKTYDQILDDTKKVKVGSATSIGCGVQYAIDAKLDIDGIAVVSDGEENTLPYFPSTYKKYCKAFDKEPTVYFYHMAGGTNNLTARCKDEGIDVQEFDLRTTALDYYSLPNIVQTMRVSRYSLVDEILGVRLLTLKEVLDVTADEKAIVGVR